MAGYIKFDGVDGEADDANHKKWSVMDSFDQTIHVPSNGMGANARRGDTVLDPIRVVKVVDSASPKLGEAICNGKVFPKVEIHVTGSNNDKGRQTWYAYELKNVRLANYTVGGPVSDGGAIPTESLSLIFEEIKTTFTGVDSAGKPKGKVEYTWKVQPGTK